MRVGIVEPTDNIYSYSSAQQPVTIPAGDVSATLHFWLYPMSGGPLAAKKQLEKGPKPRQRFVSFTMNNAAGVLGANLVLSARSWVPAVEVDPLVGDVQYVLILDEQGHEIERLLSQRKDDRQWAFRQFDLSSYANDYQPVFWCLQRRLGWRHGDVRGRCLAGGM